ncbi:MAG: hypothetical protein NXI20_18160 [bacterium]|nr:hypothetical protein [bacterium]
MSATFIHFRNQSWQDLDYNNSLKIKIEAKFPNWQFIDFDNDSGKDLLTNLKKLIDESDSNILFLELNNKPSATITSFLNHFSRKRNPSDKLYFSGRLEVIENMLEFVKGEAVKDEEELLEKLMSIQ